MHVLLVENDPRDREVLSESLRRLGARVTTAASDKEAYEALSDAGPFDVLAADLHLGPGTTGFDVARSARIRWPDLPVLYMTALNIATEPHAVPGSVTRAKPLRLAALAEDILALADNDARSMPGRRGEASGDAHA